MISEQDSILDYEAVQFPVNPLDAMASLGKRFVNHLIDYFAILFLYFGFIFMYFLLSQILFGEAAIDMHGHLESFALLYFLMVYFLYYTILENSFGITLGKIVTGTIVVDEDGNKPTLSAVMLRTLSRLVPFEVFSYFSNSRGWHDEWTDTFVINKRKMKINRSIN
jgi:uncharacterized RDD family membrane protein YckC